MLMRSRREPVNYKKRVIVASNLETSRHKVVNAGVKENKSVENGKQARASLRATCPHLSKRRLQKFESGGGKMVGERGRKLEERLLIGGVHYIVQWKYIARCL